MDVPSRPTIRTRRRRRVLTALTSAVVFAVLGGCGGEKEAATGNAPIGGDGRVAEAYRAAPDRRGGRDRDGRGRPADRRRDRQQHLDRRPARRGRPCHLDRRRAGRRRRGSAARVAVRHQSLDHRHVDLPRRGPPGAAATTLAPGPDPGDTMPQAVVDASRRPPGIPPDRGGDRSRRRPEPRPLGADSTASTPAGPTGWSSCPIGRPRQAARPRPTSPPRCRSPASSSSAKASLPDFEDVTLAIAGVGRSEETLASDEVEWLLALATATCRATGAECAVTDTALPDLGA